MDVVPDVRDLGARLVRVVAAITLGIVSGVAIAVRLPERPGAREASAFAPAFLIVALVAGCAIGWSAIFAIVRGPRSRFSDADFPSGRRSGAAPAPIRSRR
jgi:hypothetical protein